MCMSIGDYNHKQLFIKMLGWDHFTFESHGHRQSFKFPPPSRHSNHLQHQKPARHHYDISTSTLPVHITPVPVLFCLNLFSGATNDLHGETLYVCVLFQSLALAIVLALGCPPDKCIVQSWQQHRTMQHNRPFNYPLWIVNLAAAGKLLNSSNRYLC